MAIKEILGALNAAKIYNAFIDELNSTREKRELTIKDIDPESYEDQRILMQIMLRGKTVNEYFAIVEGLFEAHDQAETKEEKESIHKLTSMVMSIGETNRGIDWS